MAWKVPWRILATLPHQLPLDLGPRITGNLVRHILVAGLLLAISAASIEMEARE